MPSIPVPHVGSWLVLCVGLLRRSLLAIQGEGKRCSGQQRRRKQSRGRRVRSRHSAGHCRFNRRALAMCDMVW